MPEQLISCLFFLYFDLKCSSFVTANFSNFAGRVSMISVCDLVSILIHSKGIYIYIHTYTHTDILIESLENNHTNEGGPGV